MSIFADSAQGSVTRSDFRRVAVTQARKAHPTNPQSASFWSIKQTTPVALGVDAELIRGYLMIVRGGESERFDQNQSD